MQNKKISTVIFSFSALVLLIIFSIEYYYILTIHVWRHDSFLYRYDYYGKFVSEGRWLIYPLFPLLRHISPHLSLTLSFASLFYFSWVCARQLTDRGTALIFSLGILQIPAIYSLFGWPINPLPNYLLLVVAAVLARRLDFRVLFILFGILFHGAYNNYYNLLPLLYLAQVQKGRIRLSTLLVYYVAGFLTGYVIAQLIVLLVNGTFMQIAPWRFPLYADSISNCIRNFNRLMVNIKSHIIILHYYILIIVIIFLCLTIPYIQYILSIIKREKESEKERIWSSQFLLLVIACSTYAQSFPLGLGVSVRTTFPLYFSMLAVPLLISTKYRLISCLAIFLIALSFFVPNINTLRYYHGVTSIYLDELASITPHPERFKILFLPNIKELSAVEDKLVSLNNYKISTNESFKAPACWAPVAYAAHFPSVLYGDAAKPVLEKLGAFTFTPGRLYDHAFVDDYLIIKFNDNFTKK